MNKSYPDMFGDFIEKLCESQIDVGVCDDCEHAFPKNEMIYENRWKCIDCQDPHPFNPDLNPNKKPLNTSLNPGDNN